MSRTELAVTIVGLVATFFMPWPGEAGRKGDPAQGMALQACMCARTCGETRFGPKMLEDLRAVALHGRSHAW